MKSFLITGIEPKIWKDFKSACAFYNLSARYVFIKYVCSVAKDWRYILTHKKQSNTFLRSQIFKGIKEPQATEKPQKTPKSKVVKKS